MVIPISQLETWTRQGAVATAQRTYASIQTALTTQRGGLSGRDLAVYLQGSYKNDTNIRGDSDIDVVVELNSVFGYDTSGLSPTEKQAFQRSFSDATYTWEAFRADVLAALKAYYGVDQVAEGNKSIKIARGNGRLTADVIPCLQYRRYQSFSGIGSQRYIEGICFWTRREGRKVINYPTEHYENGVAKNAAAASGGMYKPAVRLVKNARALLYERGAIAKDVSPSYFVECLLYNLPCGVFDSRLDHLFCNMLNHVSTRTDAQLAAYVCQNGQLPLFGATPEQWDMAKARRLIAELTKLWNGWTR
jgi:Nucleotidyltransferase domain